AGMLEIDGKTITIGSPAQNATPNAMPLSAQEGARLVVAVPPATGGPQLPLVAGGAGIGALGLVLLRIGLVTGKRREVATPSTQPGFQNVETQPSLAHAVAAGTPATLDSQGVAITPANLGAGAMIGRWEILKRLGSGGMADVYLARARG